MLSSSATRQQHFIPTLLPWKPLHCHFPTGILFSCLEGSSYFVEMVTDTSLFVSFIFLSEIQSKKFNFLPPYSPYYKYFCLNHALIQDPRFTNSQMNFLLSLRVFSSLHAAHKLAQALLISAWQHMKLDKNHHQISKITTCRKKPHFHQWEPAFIISLGWVAWGFFFSFNKMFLDELTWILLVPNDLIHLPQQDKLTGLLLVRVPITSARGGKARDEGSAGLSCDLMNSHLALSSFLIICYPT